MMERILRLAKARADGAEVFSFESESESLEIQNGALREADSSQTCGVVLRVLRGTTLGSAHGVNVTDPERLVNDAWGSLVAGTEGPAAFAQGGCTPPDFEAREARSRQQMATSKELMASRMLQAADFCKARCRAAVDVGATLVSQRLRILNSCGTDAADVTGVGYLSVRLMFPGGSGVVAGARCADGLPDIPNGALEKLCRLFTAGEQAMRVPSGRRKVLFGPMALSQVLLARLAAGTSSQKVFDKVSPLAHRMGQQVLSPVLTIVNDPSKTVTGAGRLFDDEGVPVREVPVFEKGVLRNFAANLTYARKLGQQPSGIGFRSHFDEPANMFRDIHFKPTHSLEEMMALMGSGVLVNGALGGHSGNVLNGDYSVGLSPGFLVENGEVVGMLPDAMISGNAYDTLTRAVAVSREVEPLTGRPWILCEDVDFSQRM